MSEVAIAPLSQDLSPVSVEKAGLRSLVISIGIGNFLEWFDFAVYGYFTATIGKTFFPSKVAGVSVLSALAVFGIGFLARPLGALVLGPLGDRLGRKSVLIVTVFGMGVVTTAIGLIPGYAQIGLAAPAILIALRFLQGMMVGGEWSSAGIYIVESAPSHRRATAASLITGTAGVAFLLGTVLAATLSASLSEDALAAWGWRLPFIASIAMAAVAMYIRRKLSDTPVYARLEARRALGMTEHVTSRDRFNAFAVTFAFAALFGVSLYYFITYANTHLTQTVGLSKADALWLCSLALLIYSISLPIIGRLSDEIGRRELVLFSAAGLTVLAYPIFMMLNSGNHAVILLGLTLLGLLVAITAVMDVVLLVEVFPASIRSTGAALGHNLALAVLAGPGPFVAAALIRLTGNPNAPAWYLAAVSAACFVVLWFLLDETQDKDIGRA